MTKVLQLPVLSLTERVVLPGMVVPVELDETAQAAVDAARAAAGSDSEEHQLLLVPRLPDRYSSYGTVATIEQVGRLPGGAPAAVLRAHSRAKIGTGVSGPGAALWVEAEIAEPALPSDSARALANEYKALVIATLQQRDAWELIDTVQKLSDPSTIADTAGYAPYLSAEQKRTVLETADLEQRLTLLIGWTRTHLAEIDVADKIREDVREGIDKNQREFLLRQQLNAIRTELGDDEPDGSADYRGRVEAADLPDAVRQSALREVGRLERSSDASPESGWIRTWLDTVLELPWSQRTVDSTDIAQARTVLDADHHGLEDVKDRIVEYLAVRARRSGRALAPVGGRGIGTVLLLVGPPGVGKTSLGQSIANTLDRSFVRVSLGGVRDEAEIRGHRRTYVGALPGRIVRAISEAGSMNPVILLDEIDKVGADYRGDPAAALLEVLDPAQNHTFRDHYLDLDLDLSDVVFIATANTIDSIPAALLDRMELVTIDGYTEADKVAIARRHLLARQLEVTALAEDDVTITDAALHTIVSGYTREAGVRQLERALAKVLRKVATKLANPDQLPEQLVIDEPQVSEYLGRVRFNSEVAARTAVPGVATGLAVTGSGGDVLFIEATSMPAGSAASLVLTGQLGDVMKESAQIALSYLRANAESFGIDADSLSRAIHVHVPAGAVPKDGPSAGVTMVTALASMATSRPIRPEVGMTGEVTLNGRVLPIGGVKQKLLAAQRAGLRQVFLPKSNEADLDDVPAEVLASLEVTLVESVSEILAQALQDRLQSDLAQPESALQSSEPTAA